MEKTKEKAANAIFARVLKDIKPSKEELEQSVYHINMLMDRLKKVIPKDVEARVVGSVVRGTQLRGDSDIDIFLLFSRALPRDEITKKGLEYGKKIVSGKRERYEIKYAEHPYVRVYLDKLGIKADIVPAFKIDDIDDMGTAVDRSPLHAKFINKHLSERQRDEVRLLKYFFDRHNIYGAEIRTSGFSGYLCELLILKYGSLLGLLETVSHCGMPLMIDPKGKGELKDSEVIKKFNSKFVVIDPVDKNRNVAAGTSMESLARFVIIAREFVEKPDVDLFYNRGFSELSIKKKVKKLIETSGLEIFVLETKVPDKSEDVIWPQLRKVAEFIKGYAEKFGFRIYFAIPAVRGRKGIILFLTPKETLKTRLIKGPSALMCKAQKEFVTKHSKALGITVIGEDVYALDFNKYPTFGVMLADFAKGSLMKRHKDIILTSSKMFYNKLPKDYAETLYYELIRNLSI